MPLLPIVESHSVQTCPMLRRVGRGVIREADLPHGYSLRRYALTGPFPAEWPAVAGDDFFLREDYLQLIGSTASSIAGGAAVIARANSAVAGVHYQLLPFHAGRQIRPVDAGRPRVAGGLREWVADQLDYHILCLGQLQLSGAHASGELEAFSSRERAELWECTGRLLTRQLRAEGHRIDGIMLKDLVTLDAPESRHWQERGYHQLPVQPSMVLPLLPSWRTIDDYVGALSAKYRTRYRRARRKGHSLSRRLLTVAEVDTYKHEIYALYRALAGDAPFNAVELSAEYFSRLKALDPGRVQFMGYFDGSGQLVGFCSAIHHGDTLDAHFVGYDEASNGQEQLYLNMLYDLVEMGIERGAGRIDFARTALEIKSSVGAVPRYDFCGLRGFNPLINWLLPYAASWLSPLPAWTARHPFREE